MKKETFLKPEVEYLKKLIDKDISTKKVNFIHLKVWVEENNITDPYYQRQVNLITKKIEMLENCKLKILKYQ